MLNKHEKKSLKYVLFVFAAISVISICVLNAFSKIPVSKTIHTPYKLEVHNFLENKWYYEVYLESRLIIKQETIPGLSGKQYFTSKEEAEKIGLLVIDKLKSGNVPVILLNELKSENINFK